MSDATVECVRDVYGLVRRGDPHELLESLAADVTWRGVDGRRQEGAEAVAKGLLWVGAAHRVHATEFVDVGDRVVVGLTGRRMNRLGASGLHRKIFQVVVVREGKIAEIQDYRGRSEAFGAVGLKG